MLTGNINLFTSLLICVMKFWGEDRAVQWTGNGKKGFSRLRFSCTSIVRQEPKHTPLSRSYIRKMSKGVRERMRLGVYIIGRERETEKERAIISLTARVST